MTRVVSCDGTEIAYWTSGDGPPLVLVHGTTANHTTFGSLLPCLEPHVTVHALDRRGRGASGDGTDYSLAREHEDVAAVVDAVAEDQAILDGVFHPEQAARMTAPTLLLVGGDSPASLRAGSEGLAAALPDARASPSWTVSNTSRTPSSPTCSLGMFSGFWKAMTSHG